MNSELSTVNGPDPPGMNWTRWRWVLLLMAICFVGHFNRISMSVAADLKIMARYDISTAQMGTVYSAFLLTYTVFMIAGGWLIDLRGPRFALQLVTFGSAVFVVLTGCVGYWAPSASLAFVAFLVIRSLMGIVSAPLHPAAATAISLKIPLAQRSAINGLVTGAALLGIASTYVLFGQLIDRLDWPRAFMVAGLATALLGGLWSVYSTPDSVRRQGEAPPESPVASPHAAPRFAPATFLSVLSQNKNLLLLTASYAAVGYFQYIFFYWTHYYFETVLKLGDQESRFYSALPSLAMAVGMPLGGWLSDRIFARYSWRAARAGLTMSAMTASAGLLLLAIRATEPLWIVTWMSLALGVLGLAEGPFWVTAVEVGGRRGGLSASIFNTGGNAGGILAPIITPWVSDSLGYGWKAGIGVGSAVCLIGAALWLWIDATTVHPTHEPVDEAALKALAISQSNT